MGLGIASKWTGIYAGCGLAPHFAHRDDREYLYAKAHPEKAPTAWSISSAKKFPDYTVRTIDFCLTLFFVLVPAVIYLLSTCPL